jgi:hypothetical protein
MDIQKGKDWLHVNGRMTIAVILVVAIAWAILWQISELRQRTERISLAQQTRDIAKDLADSTRVRDSISLEGDAKRLKLTEQAVHNDSVIIANQRVILHDDSVKIAKLDTALALLKAVK